MRVKAVGGIATACAVASMAAASSTVLQLRFDVDAGPPVLTQIGDLWSYAPMTDRNLEANHSSGWLLPAQLPEMRTIGWNWTKSNNTNPIVKRMTTVRILGGWGPDSTLPGQPGWPDVVWREGGPDGRGALQYRWSAFFDRLDPMVDAGIAPTIVLDNVPFALAGANASLGTFGQTKGPHNNIQDYYTVVQELTKQIVQRYGQARVLSEFRFRVATEPNTSPGHWSDTVSEWNAMYDTAASAVTSVLPGAVIGPGNFCPFALATGCVNTSETVVEPIVDHIATGVNTWTNVSGATPISFLASSFYGGWTGRAGASPMTGYDPAEAGKEAMGLRMLRERHPSRLGSLPLYFHEYGMLQSPTHGGALSSEPGSFGGAWRLATSSAAAAMGVSQIFRWGGTDWLGNESDRLMIFHSNIYLPSLANAVSEAEAAAGVKSKASVLFSSDSTVPCSTGAQVPTCANGAGGAASCCVLPRSVADPAAPLPPPSAYANWTDVLVSGMGITIPPTPLQRKRWGENRSISISTATTTATAVCGAQIAPVGAGVQPLCSGDSLVLVSVFSTGHNVSRAVEATISIPASQVSPSLSVHAAYVLNRTRAPLDIIHTTASQHLGWLTYNDSAVRSIPTMLTAEGLAGISPHVDEYRDAQVSSFSPLADPGEVGTVTCSGETCSIALAPVAPPSVLALVLRPSAAA